MRYNSVADIIGLSSFI